MLRVHTPIVVAGVVRLAIVLAPARSRHTVAVIDAADRIGTGWSSRNSEVIHAGIDYPTGSLRARLRVEGRHRLYAYCARRGIAHRCTGKLIVATEPTQARRLAPRRDEAMANSVEQIGWLAGIGGADLTTIACAFGEIRRYWLDLPDDAPRPASSGIPAKRSAPGEPARDFVIASPAEHDVAGLVSLVGIESPGLTAAQAIGEHVAGMVGRS